MFVKICYSSHRKLMQLELPFYFFSVEELYFLLQIKFFFLLQIKIFFLLQIKVFLTPVSQHLMPDTSYMSKIYLINVCIHAFSLCLREMRYSTNSIHRTNHQLHDTDNGQPTGRTHRTDVKDGLVWQGSGVQRVHPRKECDDEQESHTQESNL